MQKCMARFHHQIDIVSKLSLEEWLEGLNINKKYKVLTKASWITHPK
jgi:hypothetical protein